MTTTTNPLRIVREPECAELTGLSRQRRWVLAREGRFPAPIKITERAMGWHYGDIEEWLKSRKRIAS